MARHSTNARLEAAQQIAQRIALDNEPWSEARRHVLAHVPAADSPSSEEIESAVRETFSLYMPEEHARILRLQRELALEFLTLLAPFDAYLAGSVLNGSAGIESTVRIEVFLDDPKELECFLMDRDVEFDAIDPEPSRMPDPLESLGIYAELADGEPAAIRVNVHPTRDRFFSPARRAPDALQAPWEAAGRLSREALAEVLT